MFAINVFYGNLISHLHFGIQITGEANVTDAVPQILSCCCWLKDKMIVAFNNGHQLSGYWSLLLAEHYSVILILMMSLSKRELKTPHCLFCTFFKHFLRWHSLLTSSLLIEWSCCQSGFLGIWWTVVNIFFIFKLPQIILLYISHICFYGIWKVTESVVQNMNRRTQEYEHKKQYLWFKFKKI